MLDIQLLPKVLE